MSEPELFERDVRVERITSSIFNRLLKKGFNPAFVIKMRPEDRPSIAEKLIPTYTEGYKVDLKLGEKKEVKRIRGTIRTFIIVLSTGPEDRERRIIAQACGDTGFITGLYIGLLRRQVKEGTRDVKAWAFEKLLDLERTELGFVNQTTLETWTQELVMKDDDPQSMKGLKRRKKGESP